MANYMEERIEKVYCYGKDNSYIVVYENSKGVGEIQLPEGCDRICVINGSGREVEYSVELIEKVLKDEGGLSNKEKEKKDPINKLLKEVIKKDNKGLDEADKPTSTYGDITDQEMFGFPPITKNTLTSGDYGLWSFYGLRKLRFTFGGLLRYDAGEKCSGILHFDRRDNEEIVAVRMQAPVKIKTEASKSTYVFDVYIDTNKLGKAMDKRMQHQMFSGYFELTFEKKGDKRIYCFPVKLVIQNTCYQPDEKICNPLQENNTVSIDFGTSSTCVAVDGKLMTLAAREESEGNIYENPTYIMLYRWKEIYQQWSQDNNDVPIFRKTNMLDNQDNDRYVQLDFGYSVKQKLSKIQEKEIRAILAEIKTIPKEIALGKQLSVTPYVEDEIVYLTDKYDEQDDHRLDVVALYGYILGRAINRIANGKIYTKYRVTYPTKFNDAVKERLRKSLEYGISRALPIPLRSAKQKNGISLFEVRMNYFEPVAYIGAMCGRYLKIKEDKQPVPFAVFDFGGGTLDFAYGYFAYDCDEEPTIYILGVDGDPNIGGETVIRQMSYWIYMEHAKDVSDKNIPFERYGDLKNDFPQELLNSSQIAMSNVKILNERISRRLFENKEIANSIEKSSDDGNDKKNAVDKKNAFAVVNEPDEEPESENPIDIDIPEKGRENKPEVSQPSETAQSQSEMTQSGSNFDEEIMLFTTDESQEGVKIHVNKDKLKAQLENILKPKIDQFKNSMELAFKKRKDPMFKDTNIYSHDWNKEKVIIFKAGNSSRNATVASLLEKEFKENDILLVDESVSNNNNSPRPKEVALTPKTAVAFGQLFLGNIAVDDRAVKGKEGSAVFGYNIYAFDGATGNYKSIISKANPATDWQRYAFINRDMQIFYSSSEVTDVSSLNKPKSVPVPNLMQSDWEEKHELFIRVKTENTLEATVCAKGTQPEGTPERVFTILFEE